MLTHIDVIIVSKVTLMPVLTYEWQLRSYWSTTHVFSKPLELRYAEDSELENPIEVQNRDPWTYY